MNKESKKEKKSTSNHTSKHTNEFYFIMLFFLHSTIFNISRFFLKHHYHDHHFNHFFFFFKVYSTDTFTDEKKDLIVPHS